MSLSQVCYDVALQIIAAGNLYVILVDSSHISFSLLSSAGKVSRRVADPSVDLPSHQLCIRESSK